MEYGIEVKMSIDYKVQPRAGAPHLKQGTLSDEEFPIFIRDRASLVRQEVGDVGYCRLTKFGKEVLDAGVDFTPLQKAFLSLYFQPFAVHRLGLRLQQRGGRVLPREKMFMENVPYHPGFSLDEYLHKKDLSKSDILIVPSADKGGIPFTRSIDEHYVRYTLGRDFMLLDPTTYQNLRDGKVHSDGRYSFAVMDAKGVFAITSFDITDRGPVVKQIQGVKGAKNELDSWPWESGLFHIVEDWTRKQGYRMIELCDPKEVEYTHLEPQDEHFVPLEKISARFKRVAKTRDLQYNGTRYAKFL